MIEVYSLDETHSASLLLQFRFRVSLDGLRVLLFGTLSLLPPSLSLSLSLFLPLCAHPSIIFKSI